MEINNEYKLASNPLELEVVDVLDFKDEPILVIEKDVIGNLYLSYLLKSDAEIETRILVQISQERLDKVVTGNMSIKDAFNTAEMNYLYICDFSIFSGEKINTYLFPSSYFAPFNPIMSSYFVRDYIELKSPTLVAKELIDYSIRKQKLVLDLYLSSKNLIDSIKPYAIYKVIVPVVEILKSFLSIDQRNADKYLAFSNIRQSSLGVTIEIDYSGDMYFEKETQDVKNFILLLSAQTKEDFEHITTQIRSSKYLKEYTKIINAIIDNNATLFSAYASPAERVMGSIELNKERAENAMRIIKETFDVFEDIEEITGQFLEIDIDERTSSFKVLSVEDGKMLKGKIELSLLDKIKDGTVNFGKDNYHFTIKSIYHPETTVKSEEIKRCLIDYRRIE